MQRLYKMPKFGGNETNSKHGKNSKMVWWFFSLNWDISGLRRCMLRLYKCPNLIAMKRIQNTKKIQKWYGGFFIKPRCIRVET
jgi:hypothetical protein